MKRFLLIPLTIMLFAACNNVPVIDLEPDKGDTLKENLLNANRYIAQSEETQIDAYVSRRGWQMRKLSGGGRVMETSQGSGRPVEYEDTVKITYRLEANKVHVIWHVENTDTREIHFQIGGHPAFNLPSGKVEGMIKLDCEEPIDILRSYADGSHDLVDVPLDADMGIIEISKSFFRNDSVKIHKSQTHRAMLMDTNGEPAVTVDYKTPVCAFWSPFSKNAPFVCIEPWYGIGDHRGFDGEFKDKPLMNHLLPGASFMSKYTITIGA